MEKKLIEYLEKNIGKRCILEHSAAGYNDGEILEVYNDGFVKIKMVKKVK